MNISPLQEDDATLVDQQGLYDLLTQSNMEPAEAKQRSQNFFRYLGHPNQISVSQFTQEVKRMAFFKTVRAFMSQQRPSVSPDEFLDQLQNELDEASATQLTQAVFSTLNVNHASSTRLWNVYVQHHADLKKLHAAAQDGRGMQMASLYTNATKDQVEDEDGQAVVKIQGFESKEQPAVASDSEDVEASSEEEDGENDMLDGPDIALDDGEPSAADLALLEAWKPYIGRRWEWRSGADEDADWRSISLETRGRCVLREKGKQDEVLAWQVASSEEFWDGRNGDLMIVGKRGGAPFQFFTLDAFSSTYPQEAVLV